MFNIAAPNPSQEVPADASDVLGSLVDVLGVKGLVVLLALASLYLFKFKAVRQAAAVALKRTARALVRYVRISLWAARLRMPIRLAYRLQPERWREMVAARKLTGLKRGKVKRTPMGVDVLVTLGGSLTLASLNARVTDLETGLGTRRGAVRIEARDSAHKAVVRITVRNPLAKPIRWEVPTGPVSVKDPARLSMNAFGEWTELDLQQRILIVGASGSGKSSVQRVLAAPVILAADAELEVWDLKQGTESQHYAGLADERVTDADGCRARIAYLLDVELPHRAAVMRKLKTSTWPTSVEYPDRYVMVDEFAALVRDLDPEELRRFFTLLEQARAFGVYVWIATQFPKSTNLPTEVRSQMSAIVALKMRRLSESRVVFEDLTNEGWAPHRLPGKGWMLLLDDDHQEAEESRAAWLDEGAFRGLNRPAPERKEPPRPPMPTAAPTIGLLSEEEAEQPVMVLATVLEVLTAAAPDEGVTAAEVQAATGLGKSKAYEALGAMVATGVARKVRHGRYAAVAA